MRMYFKGVEDVIEEFTRRVGTGLGSRWRGLCVFRTWQRACDELRMLTDLGEGKVDLTHGRITWPGGEVLYIGILSCDHDFCKFHGLRFGWIRCVGFYDRRFKCLLERV